MNKRTNRTVNQDVYSPNPSVGDFSVCGDGDGRAWAVVEEAFTWEQDPPDTAPDSSRTPVFDDISFRSFEVTALRRLEMRDVHSDSAVLYVVTDNRGVAINADTLGDSGFQLYTGKSCASDSQKK